MDSLDQLRVDTPEQIALELPLAGVGSRFLAMAADTLLQAVLFVAVVVLMAVFVPLLVSLVGTTGAAFLPAILVVFLFCLYWGYFAFFEIVWRGQTPGKRVTHLRVIRDTGRPLDVQAALIRNLLRAVDALPLGYGVGVACMLVNRQNKRLGDVVAGTVVIHDRGPASLDDAWIAPAPAAGSAVLPPGAKLSGPELVIVETFLERRASLEWSARDRMADQIVARITQKTGAVPAPGQTPEEFLEAIARDARASAHYR